MSNPFNLRTLASYGYLEQGSNLGYSMEEFHDYLLYYLFFIFIFLFTLLFRSYFVLSSAQDLGGITSISSKNIQGSLALPFKYFTHSKYLEILWTLFPGFILMLIALPSFNLLYSLDELAGSLLTIKILGNQWYWSYEGSNGLTSSYLSESLPRLLSSDSPLILPISVPIRLLITSSDVIHSFAIPSLSLKIDAIPGRLNSISLFILRSSVYYGQCSELCGLGHGFMPIHLIAI
jgi:heme/copper-type cytochrome/quinol oxidase subunit 2